MPPALTLGPLLRYVGEENASIWVETAGPCEVTVSGDGFPDASERTFEIAGHHYALVCLEGLEPGRRYEYSLALDGEAAWPQPDDEERPHPSIRTIDPDQTLRVVFGSCRVAAPHEPPYALTKDDHPEGREVDALYAYMRRMVRGEDPWPHTLILLGDQVYADEVSPRTVEHIKERRERGVRPDAPDDQVADFEEYTWLYQESWGDPPIRWLLSTVSTAMIFDDHDVHDDWNTSRAWVEEMRRKHWWEDRITGAFMSYWVYQHIGNLSVKELGEDELFNRVREAGDGTAILRDFALHADSTTEGVRFSFERDLGRTKLVVMDTRAGRVLDDGRRSMLDDEEWSWVEDELEGDYDHLLIGSTLPFFLSLGMQGLESWNEALCERGGIVGRLSEKLRQGLDLEHWGAFDDSFRRLMRTLERVGSSDTAPASIVMLSGDVHHAYLQNIAFRRGRGVRSAVWQAVCSPFRNPLNWHERLAIRIGVSKAAGLVGTLLARSAGVPEQDVRWRFVEGPYFDNQVASIDIQNRSAKLRLEKTIPSEDWRNPELETTFEHRLA